MHIFPSAQGLEVNYHWSHVSVLQQLTTCTVCLGIHLAMHEMLLGAFLFFKTCPNLMLARSTTDESMEFENYFLITPKAHRCEVTADQSL